MDKLEMKLEQLEKNENINETSYPIIHINDMDEFLKDVLQIYINLNFLSEEMISKIQEVRKNIGRCTSEEMMYNEWEPFIKTFINLKKVIENIVKIKTDININSGIYTSSLSS